MLGNSQADSHPWNRAIEDMIRLADEYSDGRIEIINYPNATLGNENEMFESMMHGTMDMCIVDPTVGNTYAKELELFSLPFLFRNYEHWEAVLDGEIGQDFSNLILEKDRLSQDHGLLGRFHPQCAGCQSTGAQH